MSNCDSAVNGTGYVLPCLPLPLRETRYPSRMWNQTSPIANRTRTNSTLLSTHLVTPTPFVTVINITITPFGISTPSQTSLPPSTSSISTPAPSLATVIGGTTSTPNDQTIIVGCSVGIGVLAAMVGLLSFLLWRRRQRKPDADDRPASHSPLISRPYSAEDREEYLPAVSDLGQPITLTTAPLPEPPPQAHSQAYGAADHLAPPPPLRGSDRSSFDSLDMFNGTMSRDFGRPVVGPDGRLGAFRGGRGGGPV